MCDYAHIENIRLNKGKTVKEVNADVRKEVENIYLEGWSKDISIPFWDREGRFYLANPDGSEDLVERMAAEGHQVGSHTWNHVRLLNISQDTLREEVGRTEEALGALLGPGDYWLRPPYGAVDEADRTLIRTPMIKWSIDPRDWEKLDAPQVTAAVLEAAEPDQIILLHDIYPESVDAALEIIDQLHAQGYYFCTIDQLFAARGLPLKDGEVYWNAYP